MVGLLFVDLDGFKAVNDSFGHRAGDDVLRCIAQRMQETIRGGDVVARLGGDEFIVLLEPVDTESSAVDVAERIVLAASAPITTTAGDKVRIGASVGVAISHDGVTEAEQLLNEADVAAYRAKAAGRGRAEVFDESLRRELAERLSLETRARSRRSATTSWSCTTSRSSRSRPDGSRASRRWCAGSGPASGWCRRRSSSPLAEASDLICDLDCVGARTGDPPARRVGRRGRPRSPDHGGQHLGPAHVESADRRRCRCRHCGPRASQPHQLVLEITETVLIDGVLAIEHLNQLRGIGVAISIDDFGTGYNSISRLQHLPVDIIKIDKTFVDSTEESSDKLLQLMVQAAHAFGLPGRRRRRRARPSARRAGRHRLRVGAGLLHRRTDDGRAGRRVRPPRRAGRVGPRSLIERPDGPAADHSRPVAARGRYRPTNAGVCLAAKLSVAER